jgi:hypothetical protein
MFNVPFGEWWNPRWMFYGTEQVMSNSYPYMFKFYSHPEGNVKVYSNMRLDIAGRNMTEMNMTSRPEFLPFLGTVRGGTAVVDWYMQYLTTDELASYPSSPAWNDGWVISLNGTVAMDEQAAMAVIDLDPAMWDDFDSWWSANETSVNSQYGSWLQYEAGGDRLDIYPMYDGFFQLLNMSLSAERLGDQVVLHYDVVSWGMEALMARWLHEAFLPNEWYMENMTFHASIGPDKTDLDINTVVDYALLASETLSPGVSTPAWVWQGMLGDVNPSSPPAVNHSDIDPYLGKEYLCKAVGNSYYGGMVDYDYTPGAFNLSANETMKVEWPSGQQQFEIHVPAPPAQLYASVTPLNDTMTCLYSEPLVSDDVAPGSVAVDRVLRAITFTGPIDMWHWARNQTTHSDLTENWSRIDLLPHGVPWIEFVPEHNPLRWAASFNLTGVPSMPVVNTPVNITVTALDNYGQILTDYIGTVHFTSNRSGEVDLPSDYTFLPSDGGVHKFQNGLNLHSLGWFRIECTDAANASVLGFDDDIFVIPEPSAIDHFAVEVLSTNGVVVRGQGADVRLTAYDQYGRVLSDYDGTVTFLTNATSVSLPVDYTFSPAEAGVAVVHGLVFHEIGIYNFTVVDVDNQSASGTEVNIHVTVTPKIDYRLYDMFEQPWGDWWPWRLVSYKTDIILNNKPHEYTMVYNPDMRNQQGIIYAPYRWNVTAKNMTTMNVHSPEFMPILGTPDVPGAAADMHIWFQYLDNASWNGYWVPTWSSNWNWSSGVMDALMPGQFNDGYYLGTLYTVSLNREAALEWLGMPITADPATWWTANRATYMTEWQRWITNEGNVRLDIWPAYEWPYVDLATMMDLLPGANGKLTLKIAHFSWGFEILTTRFLREIALCAHEPYYEDFNLSAHYGDDYANVTYDAVCQNDLHAVKANGTANDPAWVWEPQRKDYVAYSNPATGYDSQFNPWNARMYTSWNSGDGYFGIDVRYDFTPQWFNLTSYMTFEIQLPTRNNVIGYMGERLMTARTSGAIWELKKGNRSAYENITVHGTMRLGYYMTGTAPGLGPDLRSMYNNETKTLVMVGPMDFDNYRFWDGLLYHSAPWIEFDVSNGTLADFPPFANAGVDQSVGLGATVTFDGSGSFDEEGPLNYTWTFVYDGQPVTLWGVNPQWVFLIYGEYNVTLTVRDTIGQTDSDNLFVILVIPEPGAIDHFAVEVLSAEGVVICGQSADVRLTAYDQYGRVLSDYAGTVTFFTNATSVSLPTNHTFSPAEAGVAVVYGLVFHEIGIYNLTAVDVDNQSASGTEDDIHVTIAATIGPHQIDYRLYDMFEQPWGDWWRWRLVGYKTDIILNNKPHEYTMVYNPDTRNLQGIIYAPHRWNVTAKNMTTLNVHMPEFMPILGAPDVAGAAADMRIWFQYLDNRSWNGYWKPTWQTNWNWSSSVMDALMPGQFNDGYYLGTLYTISMNREAALEWLGMPLTANPATWWTANRAAYMSAWQRWITNEGNVRLDIWPAYEWPYVDLATMMDFVTGADGKLTLKIAHFSWGFEILTTRWLREVALCAHEPYYEDFNLSAHYTDEYANVSYDAVCQYNLHAVRANQTTNSAAWVWEPQRIDHAAVAGSEFLPWQFRTYNSSNSGDGYFGSEVPYDFTPQWFNLTSYMTFEIQLPTGNNVVGYMGEKLTSLRTSGAIFELKKGNKSAYENITVHGPMELGYNMTGLGPGAPNLWDYYNPATKTLMMTGPIDFDNYRFWDGLLYQSAPRIEFNVTNVTWGNADSLPFANAGIDQSVGSGITVTFDGSGSFDLEGPLNYTWTFVYDGQPVTLWGVNPQWIFLIDGEYHVTLTVRDSIGQTDSDAMTVTVTTIPEFPAIGIPLLALAVGSIVLGFESQKRRRRS